MNRLVAVLAGIMLVVLAGCNAEAPKIGVVDVVRVINESNAGKKANAELDALVKAKQAELKRKADAVEKLKKGIEKEQAATRKAEEEKLGKANSEYQKLVSASDAEVQKRAAQLKSMILEDLKKVLGAIGREEKFLLILTTDNMAYFQKTIDITDRVVKKYNESTESK
ncbi:MAG: OmpH family outer membrane protein [Syntrophobacteraceae bacterium]